MHSFISHIVNFGVRTSYPKNVSFGALFWRTPRARFLEGTDHSTSFLKFLNQGRLSQNATWARIVVVLKR